MELFGGYAGGYVGLFASASLFVCSFAIVHVYRPLDGYAGLF